MKDINSASGENYSNLNIFCDKTCGDASEIIISGSYSIFVNCGSQYAIWHQFPAAIHYTIKDMDSGEVYTSINNELSISPSDNQIYDDYAKRECGKIVTEKFSIVLTDIYFLSPPVDAIKNFELACRYYSDLSNTVQILDEKIYLKRF